MPKLDHGTILETQGYEGSQSEGEGQGFAVFEAARQVAHLHVRAAHGALLGPDLRPIDGKCSVQKKRASRFPAERGAFRWVQTKNALKASQCFSRCLPRAFPILSF